MLDWLRFSKDACGPIMTICQPRSDVQGKIIQTLVKIVLQEDCSGVDSTALREEMELSHECNKDEREFTDREQRGGVSGWETTKRRCQGGGTPADLRGFLLKAGRGLRSEGWGQGACYVPRLGDFC